MTVLGSLLGFERAIYDHDLWGRWKRGDDTVPESLAGVRVTPESAMQLAAVWACVTLISDAIATLPLGAFFRRGGVRLPARRPHTWIDQPNPEQDRVQWVSQQLVSLLLDSGTAYVYTVRDRRGDVLEAWNVPGSRVTPRRVRGGVEYDVHDPDLGLHDTFSELEMFHISGISWPGQIKGMSPLDAAMHVIGAGLGAQEFAERFYGQGFSAAGIIEVPGDLEPEDAKALKANFAKGNSGLKKAGLPGVLTNGATWKPTTVTPEQAQFLESRSYSRGEIAGFFRVPPHMIGDVDKETSWGTGIEQQGIAFVTYTLTPWIERLEQAYTRHMLLMDPGVFAKFNVNGLLRGDFKTRMEGYGQAVQSGWMSADEIRALEDRPPLPDGLGQKYYVQGALRPVDEPYSPNQPAGGPPDEQPNEEQ